MRLQGVELQVLRACESVLYRHGGDDVPMPVTPSPIRFFLRGSGLKRVLGRTVYSSKAALKFRFLWVQVEDEAEPGGR